MTSADADARDHAYVPEHSLFEGERAGTVSALDVLPYCDASVYGPSDDVKAVVGNRTCGDGA